MERPSMKLFIKFLIAIYIFINTLFLYKYGSRLLDTSGSILLIAVYIFLFFGFLFAIYQYKSKIDSYKHFKFIYITLIVLFLIFSIWFLNTTNPNNLNVDRWSAMHIGIESLLNFKYPYVTTDHLGGRTSNLPGLFVIGLPFYLLKHVGYLQIFVFIILSYFIFSYFKKNSLRLLAICLFLFSPAFLWEVLVRSDLMSNFTIILLFIIYWYQRYATNIFKKSIILGSIIALLVLTRLTAIIPLAIFLFRPFCKETNCKQKILFLGSFALMSLLLILPVYLLAETNAQFLEFNPLKLQTSTMPTFAGFIFLALAFWTSFYSNKIYHIITYSFLLLFIAVFFTFLLFIFKYGIKRSIHLSLFDISYFDMSLPFLVFALVMSFSNLIYKNSPDISMAK